jgi:hypothetical protein
MYLSNTRAKSYQGAGDYCVLVEHVSEELPGGWRLLRTCRTRERRVTRGLEITAYLSNT